MKVFPFKIPKAGEKSFIYQEDNEPLFYDKLHAHEEIQISIILKGSGELIVGDTLSSFQPGDVFVFGSNLPHLLRSELGAGNSFMKTLFFTESSFGSLIPELKEHKEVVQFLSEINKGVKVVSSTETIKRKFNRFKKASAVSQVVLFFELFDVLVKAEKKTLSTFSSLRNYSENEGKRMGKIFQLIFSEFQREITLAEVSSLANMTPNAFCRYFKQHTKKTFFEFLLEIRLENACKILRKNKEMPINEVMELCGFNNISHFNRKFKNYKQMTPSQYRKVILKDR